MRGRSLGPPLHPEDVLRLKVFTDASGWHLFDLDPGLAFGWLEIARRLVESRGEREILVKVFAFGEMWIYGQRNGEVL